VVSRLEGGQQLVGGRCCVYLIETLIGRTGRRKLDQQPHGCQATQTPAAAVNAVQLTRSSTASGHVAGQAARAGM
jgi:hypothetical protein